VTERGKEMEATLNRNEQAVAVAGFSELSNLRTVDKAFVLGSVLCLLQALDGVLTSIGVSRFGIEWEGNPFIRALMEDFGPTTALGIVKCFAILLVVGLTFFARRLPWINNAMGAVSCIYLFVAIIPWSYYLFIAPPF